MVQLLTRVTSLACVGSLCIRNTESLPLCPVYNSGCVVTGKMMDLGNNGGKLDITDPVRHLIPVCFMRAQALTVGIYRSGPDGLISSHDMFPYFMPQSGMSLICQFVVFQMADQIAKPLAIAKSQEKYNMVHQRECWPSYERGCEFCPLSRAATFRFCIAGGEVEQPPAAQQTSSGKPL